MRCIWFFVYISKQDGEKVDFEVQLELGNQLTESKYLEVPHRESLVWSTTRNKESSITSEEVPTGVLSYFESFTVCHWAAARPGNRPPAFL